VEASHVVLKPRPDWCNASVMQNCPCCIALISHHAASKGVKYQRREHSIQMRVRAPDPVVREECSREDVAPSSKGRIYFDSLSNNEKAAQKKTLVANGNV
jgi:hypothetical protein